jgi:hypothetical protein
MFNCMNELYEFDEFMINFKKSQTIFDKMYEASNK